LRVAYRQRHSLNEIKENIFVKIFLKMIQNNGIGTVVCQRVLEKTEITKLSHHYPLRLMKPKTHSKEHQAVYVLSYGGGLVGGDSIQIHAEVHPDCQLSFHSPSSTKVFKKGGDELAATQSMKCNVMGTGFLALLPEPITCYANAMYRQHQTFHLQEKGSLLLLDWLTSGRTSQGECWQFDTFQSENLIYHDGELVVRDAWLLNSEFGSLEKRMGKYQCAANLILIGPLLSQSIEEVIENHKDEVIYRSNSFETVPIIWSMSKLSKGEQFIGVIIRAAAVDSTIMRDFIKTQIRSIPAHVLEYFSRI
jgi:urease accessory protein